MAQMENYLRVSDSMLDALGSVQSHGGSSSESEHTLKLKHSFYEGTFGNDYEDMQKDDNWACMNSLALQDEQDSGPQHNHGKIDSG